MLLEIKETADGFPTLYAPELNEHYHSTNGAFTESNHVFIDAGLKLKLSENPDTINILEIGLGTGLNLLLTKKHIHSTIKINYQALEPFPLEAEITAALKQYDLSGFGLDTELFELIHQINFGETITATPGLTFIKINKTLEDFSPSTKYDLVYFDAFGPQVQPEIWSTENFQKLFDAMKHKSVLVTYCAKGIVRRSMLSVGFEVERLPGPPGKREMLRATKK